MFKTWKKVSFSLMAVAALFFLFAPFASAQAAVPMRERAAWGIPAKNIIGMDVKARQGETAGKVEDITFTRSGKSKDMIVGLTGTNREVAVPMRDFRFYQNSVMYKGTRASLDKKPTVAFQNTGAAPARGYYSEQSQSQNLHHGSAYWDTHLPRTPYTSAQRWMP